MASSDQNAYICRSAISLPFHVNIGLVVDDVLGVSILREKYDQLIRLWPLIGGELLSAFDTRKFRCGSTTDFKSRTVSKDLASFYHFSKNEEASPRIIIDNPTSLDQEFLFDVSSSSKAISKLRVTVLNDATLLGFSFAHALSDGKASYDTIRYFCDLLSNKPIPKFVLPPDATGRRISDLVLDGEEGVAEPASEAAQPEQRELFVSRPLTALNLHARYALLRLGQLLGVSTRLTHRTVYLPGAWIDEVRTRAQKELDLELGSDKDHPKMQLTRNDIIAALYLKMAYGWKSVNDNPVDYIGPVNYRRLIEPYSEAGTHYTHNSFILLLCQFSERELQTNSIARIAARIRLTTKQYSHPAVVKREIRRIEDRALAPALQNIRGGVIWGVPMVSPWTTFDYTSLDFTGAVPKGGRKPSVVFANPNVPLMVGALPSPLAISLKDGAGGYWLRAANTGRGWDAFERCTHIDSLFA